MNMDIFKEIENKKNAAQAFYLGVVDVRQVADSFRFLEGIKTAAKDAQEALSKVLLENKVSELFPKTKEKVVVVEGSTKTMLDPEVVQEFCTPQAFSKIVSVSETKIKSYYADTEGKGFSENPDVVIAKAKKITGKNVSSVKVKKMTLTELKEASK